MNHGALPPQALSTLPDVLQHARSVVFKLGSRQVASDDGRIRWAVLRALAQDVAMLISSGVAVAVVTSGSVVMGCRRLRLSLDRQPLRLDQRQAAASVGQPLLMQAWSGVMKQQKLLAAQVLLTVDDTEQRRRHLNARDTLQRLQQGSVVPIINENDTVTTREIRFGDNDRLAARVAVMIQAQLLVILTDVDGLYPHVPLSGVQPSTAPIAYIDKITEDHMTMAQGASDSVGSGGMVTKLMAAQIGQSGGCATVIMRGLDHSWAGGPMQRLRDGALHTFFPSATTGLAARKAWISRHQSVHGRVVVDDGACCALRQQRSLLPSGVLAVEGDFRRGDPVEIVNDSGSVVGHGLTSYDIEESRKIVGCQSHEIGQRLGHDGRSTMIHRDNIVMYDES